MSRSDHGKKYIEWPSAIDYSKALKKTVKAEWPFIDLEEVDSVRGKLEWFPEPFPRSPVPNAGKIPHRCRAPTFDGLQGIGWHPACEG